MRAGGVLGRQLISPRKDDADGGQAEQDPESPTEATAELSGFGRMTTASVVGQIGLRLRPPSRGWASASDLRLSRWAGGCSTTGSRRLGVTRANHFSDDIRLADRSTHHHALSAGRIKL